MQTALLGTACIAPQLRSTLRHEAHAKALCLKATGTANKRRSLDVLAAVKRSIWELCIPNQRTQHAPPEVNRSDTLAVLLPIVSVTIAGRAGVGPWVSNHAAVEVHDCC